MDSYVQINENYLESNSKKPNVNVTSSGLQYEILKEGTGKKPYKHSVVKVHYTGKDINGIEFDSSIKRGQPAQFPLNGVIEGWTEGLQLMNVGSKYLFTIPSKLAYGSRGAGNIIKPNSTLIFEVELLDII